MTQDWSFWFALAWKVFAFVISLLKEAHAFESSNGGGVLTAAVKPKSTGIP